MYYCLALIFFIFEKVSSGFMSKLALYTMRLQEACDDVISLVVTDKLLATHS
jgi:hypothetical protein